MYEGVILRDEQMFLDIVRTTPDYVEAVDLLRRAKTAVLEEKEKALNAGDAAQDQKMARLLTKLGDEIKYINQREDRIRWGESIRNALGKEMYDAVKVEMSMKRFPPLRGL